MRRDRREKLNSDGEKQKHVEYFDGTGAIGDRRHTNRALEHARLSHDSAVIASSVNAI